MTTHRLALPLLLLTVTVAGLAVLAWPSTAAGGWLGGPSVSAGQVLNGPAQPAAGPADVESAAVLGQTSGPPIAASASYSDPIGTGRRILPVDQIAVFAGAVGFTSQGVIYTQLTSVIDPGNPPATTSPSASPVLSATRGYTFQGAVAGDSASLTDGVTYASYVPRLIGNCLGVLAEPASSPAGAQEGAFQCLWPWGPAGTIPGSTQIKAGNFFPQTALPQAQQLILGWLEPGGQPCISLVLNQSNSPSAPVSLGVAPQAPPCDGTGSYYSSDYTLVFAN